MKLTKKEKEEVLNAVTYFLYNATHHEHGMCGLDEDAKGYKELKSVEKKIKGELK